MSHFSFKGNNARISLPTWIPRSSNGALPITAEAALQRPQSSVAHVNLGPSAQTYVLTERLSPSHRSPSQRLSTSVSNESTLSAAAQTDEHPDVNISVNPANNNAINDNADNDSQSDDGNQVIISSFHKS